METQGSQIFHKIAGNIDPKKLQSTLLKCHRAKIDRSQPDKTKKVLLHHPSPCSFGCIDMVFGLTNDWSPYFNESCSAHLNRITQLLVKTFIIYSLHHMCAKFGLVEKEKRNLAEAIRTDLDTGGNKEEKRKEVLTNLAREFANRYAKLKIFKILNGVRSCFQRCIKWYIALGFFPVEMDGEPNFKDMAEKAAILLRGHETGIDDIQKYLAAYFSILGEHLNRRKVLKPVQVKHGLLITSKEGRFNATTYNGKQIWLMSFDDIEPDPACVRTSLAAHMLAHEYLYLFAHNTNAVQTTRKLCQSTVVVSSEPAFSINTKSQPASDIVSGNKKMSTNTDISSQISGMYATLSEESKEKLKYNPTVLSFSESHSTPQSFHQIKIFQDMYEQLHHKTLDQPSHCRDLDTDSLAEKIASKSVQLDMYEDPKRNEKRSNETIQAISDRKEKEKIRREHAHMVKMNVQLQDKIKEYIQQNAINNLKLSMCKMTEQENKKNISTMEKEIGRLQRLNGNLNTQLKNVSTVVRELTDHVNVKTEENEKFLNLIMNGKDLRHQGDSLKVAWTVSPSERRDIVQSFLSMLSAKEVHTSKNNHDALCNNEQEYESVLLKLKIEVVPIFHKVQSKKELDLVNSWIPTYMRDKCSTFSDIVTDTEREEANSDVFQICETKWLKIIDVNPITQEERQRIQAIAQTTDDGSLIKATGPGGSLITKKFLNIQFPQSGNVGSAVDDDLKKMWSQMIKTIFSLDESTFTNTGQKMLPRPTQQTYEKFIIPFLTYILDDDTYILETTAFLMKLENKYMFHEGGQDINTFIFDDIFYFFWDQML